MISIEYLDDCILMKDFPARGVKSIVWFWHMLSCGIVWMQRIIFSLRNISRLLSSPVFPLPSMLPASQSVYVARKCVHRTMSTETHFYTEGNSLSLYE